MAKDRKMKKLNLLLIALAIVPMVSCLKYDPKITVADMKETIGYLASDSLKGRAAGSTGDSLAAVYVRDKLGAAGLQLLFDNGFETFQILTQVEPGEGNSLKVDGKEFVANTDFQPYSFTANKNFSGKVVFAGYGFDIREDSLQWDDYKSVNADGKWVLVLKGDPELEKQESVFVKYSDERTKVLAATDHKAAGVLLVAGPSLEADDKLAPMFFDKNSSSYDIPVIQITRAVADEILKKSKKTIASLSEEINKSLQPMAFEVEANVTANASVVRKEVETRNVAAILPGTDSTLKNEIIIIGAHHDHLGMGGPGSGSRALDTIAVHNGADDNASGVAAVIELAEKAAAEKSNRRTLVFATFAAEEMGLVGSREFVARPPVDLSKVVAMVNFDMVGRFDTAKTLSIGGDQNIAGSRGIAE